MRTLSFSMIKRMFDCQESTKMFRLCFGKKTKSVTVTYKTVEQAVKKNHGRIVTHFLEKALSPDDQSDFESDMQDLIVEYQGLFGDVSDKISEHLETVFDLQVGCDIPYLRDEEIEALLSTLMLPIRDVIEEMNERVLETVMIHIQSIDYKEIVKRRKLEIKDHLEANRRFFPGQDY